MIRKLETRPLPWVMGKPAESLSCALCLHQAHRGEISRGEVREAIQRVMVRDRAVINTLSLCGPCAGMSAEEIINGLNEKEEVSK